MNTKIKNFFEFILLFIFFCFSKLIGINLSSLVGGVTLKIYGIFSKKSRLAYNNIKKVFPKLRDEEINDIVSKMWFHFGRVVGEYPHLNKINVLNNKNIEIVNKENLTKPLKKFNNCLFFSGHIGNWELTSHPLTSLGYKINFIYRAPNNKLVDGMLRKIRKNYGVDLIRKGPSGARECIKVLKSRGGNIGMLIDQKMNDGIKSKFFGFDVMTASAIAKLSIKFKCPIIPSVCIRKKGIKFVIKYFPPIDIKKINELKTEANIINHLNKYIEEWIEKNPEQWIWIHNRW